MVRATIAPFFAIGASAFTSFNSPSLPGNWNLPTDSGFGADLAHSLPEINVRYQYPAVDAGSLQAAAENEENFENRLAAIRHDKSSFLRAKGQAELDAALSGVALGPVDESTGADAFMLGLFHSPRPHRSSFFAVDPMEILPPGIAGGLAAKSADATPYTLILNAPEQDAVATNSLIDSFAKIETGHERAIEASAIAEKQRLLNAEISRVHDLVAASRRSSFLSSLFGSNVRKADYEVVLHAPSESRADINSAVNSILRTETSKLSSAAAADQKLKAALLSAEIAKIGRIVRGH